MCAAAKNFEKFAKTTNFETSSHSRSSMLKKVKSPSPVLVMMSNTSVPICNCFHTRRANSSKITFFQGVPLFDALVWREAHPSPWCTKFCHKKTRVLAVAHSEVFVILACTVSIQIKSVMDKQTNGQTPGRWLRHTKHYMLSCIKRITDIIDWLKTCLKTLR